MADDTLPPDLDPPSPAPDALAEELAGAALEGAGELGVAALAGDEEQALAGAVDAAADVATGVVEEVLPEQEAQAVRAGVEAGAAIVSGGIEGGAEGALGAGLGAGAGALGSALSEAGVPPEVVSAGVGLLQQGIGMAMSGLAGTSASMPAVTYHVTIVDDPHAIWQLRRLHLREALSEPYLATMELVSEDLGANYEALLGASCELTLHRGSDTVRTVDGVIHKLEYIGVQSDRLQLRVELVSAFSLLAHRVNTRLWQDASVTEVVEEVLADALDDYGREVDLSGLMGRYPPRTYIVQYHESDLDFVSRLLEDEGITYWFDHERAEGCEVLVLEDSSNNYADVATIDDNPELQILAHLPDEAELETVQQLQWIHGLGPTKIYQRTFDWSDPEVPIETSIEGCDVRGHERELYHHGRFVEDEPEPRTQRKLELRKRHDEIARGVANVTGLRPGRKFGIAGHERAELDGEYLLRSAVHVADCPEVIAGAQARGPRYRCSFECTVYDPDRAPQPPRDAPRPRIYGPQTGIVTGPEGEEIHTDEHGRVKVRFDWDRLHGLHDDSSMWIRVAHNWAGPGFGTFFVPRVGMEVVVEFLEGDPAQPLVTGCVYNGDNPVSVGLPDNKTQSTIRTQSSPGGEGYNELRFDDTAGSEELFIHAQKDFVEVVENDHSTSVGAKQSNSVGGDQSVSVEGERSKTVTKDETNTLRANRTTRVSGNEQLTVTGTTTITSTEKVTLNCRDAYEQNVGGASTVSIVSGTGGAGDGSISAARNLQLNATSQFGVAQGDDAATIVLTGGAATHATSAGFSASAEGEMNLSSDTNLVASGSTRVTISQGGASVTLTGDKAEVSASEITFSVGGNMIKIDGAGVTISGAKIDIAGTGVVTVTGSVVNVG